jgi:hypothetical protein
MYYLGFIRLLNNESRKFSNKLFLTFSILHLILAGAGMTTFFVPYLLKYVPYLAGVIIMYDVIAYVTVLLIRKKGKYLLQVLLLTSFISLFTYFPFKSFMEQKQYNVMFRLVTDETAHQEKYFIYLNYFKYGKECLPLYKINDNVFQSKPVIFHAGGINFSYKITEDSFDLNTMLIDQSIKEHRIKLHHNDSIFYVQKD